MIVDVPYPPVFRDWQYRERRVSTRVGPGGVGVEMFQPESGSWRLVELTEEDACLLAVSLLQRAGRVKLAKRLLKGLRRGGPDG